MKIKTLYQLVSILVLALFYIQCSKTDETPATQPVQPQLSAFDQKINTMVKDFKTKMNSDLKSGEIMSTDSALWYISTTLNATYANSYHDGQTPGKTQMDVLVINLPDNDGIFTIAQIENLYDRILDTTRTVYHQIQDTDKQLAAIILESQPTTSEVNIKMLTYSTWGLQWWEQFASTDSYFWGFDDDLGNPVNPNAPVKLMDKFARHVYGNPYIAPYPGYYWVSTQQRTIWDYTAYPYNYDPTAYPPYTNYLDFYLFSSFTAYPGFHETLCADELNFYLSKMIEFADVTVPQQYNISITPTHRCYQVSVGCQKAWCGQANVPGNLVSINHQLTFYYGNRVTLPFPPEEF